MVAHRDGPAILQQIATIEPSIDPADISDWGPDTIRRLERGIAAAAVILRDASLILLRQEEMEGRDLLDVLDASILAAAFFFFVGSLLLLSFLRARSEALRAGGLAHAAAEAARRAAAEQQALQRLLSVLEHLPVAVLTTGADSTIRWINGAASEIFGVAPETAKGRAVGDFLLPRGADAAAIRSATAADPVRTTARRSDGAEFPAEASAALSDGPGEPVTIWMVRDITQKLQQERRQREADEDHRRAQRLESLGTLAGGIAHELNSPIQFLTDNTDFLRGAFADLSAAFAELQLAAPAEQVERIAARHDLRYLFDEVPRAVAQSRIGLDRIAEIVLATRRFLHPAGTAMEDNDLNQIVRTAVLLSKNQWRYVADLDLDLADDLPAVRSNAGELNQVLLNLIVNAVHAIEDKGGGMGRITIATRAGFDGVECSVSDTGTGIASELREKVFDLFFTTKAPGRGTGQGLALVHSIVTQIHGGRIVFDSAPGQGTVFRFTLPVAGAAPEVAPVPAQAAD